MLKVDLFLQLEILLDYRITNKLVMHFHKT